jgi:hypothetical protein
LICAKALKNRRDLKQIVAVFCFFQQDRKRCFTLTCFRWFRFAIAFGGLPAPFSSRPSKRIMAPGNAAVCPRFWAALQRR